MCDICCHEVKATKRSEPTFRAKQAACGRERPRVEREAIDAVGSRIADIQKWLKDARCG